MKKILLGLGLCFLGVFTQAQNGLEGIVVEKYYISNAADNAADPTLPVGSVTYRIYADMLPGYKFKMAYGDPNHTLTFSTTTTFYNESNYGGVNPTISVNNSKKKTAMLDSYLTVGAACAGYLGVMKSEDNGTGNFVITNGCLANADAKMGLPLTTQDGMMAGSVPTFTIVGTMNTDLFNDGSANGNSFSTSGATWSCLAGSVGATASNKVLIAQMTTDGVFSFNLNIQIQTPSNTAEKYVVSNPITGEISIPSLSQTFNPTLYSAGYAIGDFHQHSTFTDGSYSLPYMMNKNTRFGLTWWANSEHGGGFTTNGLRTGTDLGTNFYWDSYNPNPILGTVSSSSGHQKMWRWQSLRDSSFSEILRSRQLYPDYLIIQSYEMNVPGHEHASMGLIANQFDVTPNVNPLSQYEYMFDNSDADLIGGAALGWTKSTNTGHTKTLEAITWLQTNYPTQSYLVPAHPERKPVSTGYSISGFRDMNNAGPSVCFGFESMPGHQKDGDRGGYSKTAQGGGTYGGTGYFSARVGGLWDALLTEGRAWWLFSNSDCHDESGDFYPGQYQKNYTYSLNRMDPQSVLDGLRSGNTWVVEGDLVDSLIFEVYPTSTPSSLALMGQTLNLTDNSLTIHIKVRDAQGNNYNTFGGSNNPTLNHVDLIAGLVKGKLAPSDSKYNVDSVQTTQVIARFDAAGNVVDSKGITSSAWTTTSNGWKEMTFTINNVSDSMYFRLRGSNLGLNVANETDAAGNPLSDTLMGTNDAVKAFADLWFYSNPIFVAYNNGTVKAQENSKETSYSIYPNPAKDELNIEVSENSTIQMFDINGRQVIANKAVNANQKESINVSNINNGIYFVKISSEKSIKIQKIVITK